MSEHGISVHVGDFAFWAELGTNAKVFSPNDMKVLRIIFFIETGLDMIPFHKHFS